jgi:hypothetical protein
VVIEAGVVAGYLVAWAVRKAKRAGGRLDAEADRFVDAGLDRLHEVVEAKLGGHPALAELVAEAEATRDADEVDDLTRQQVELALTAAARKDDIFGRVITGLVAQIRQGERAAGSAVTAGPGAVVFTGNVQVKADNGSTVFGQVAGDVHIGARRPAKSHVELVSVTIGQRRGDDQSPVLDIKVRNIGEQPAVLKRAVVRVDRAVRCGSMDVSMRLTAYRLQTYGAHLPVSATYDVLIPPPEDAVGAAAGTGISQVVAPGEADRFEVRLGMEPTFDAYAYRVRLVLIYDGDDRSVTSAPVAVAFPERRFVYPVSDIREQIRKFYDDVAKVRVVIDREMTARGLPAPDWESGPPRSREELPGGLLALDGMADSQGSSARGGYFEVTDAFWDPERCVALHVREFGRMYGELEKIVQEAVEVDDVLRGELPRAQATLAGLAGLYAEPPLLPEPPAPESPKAKTPAELMQNLLRAKTDRDREEAVSALRTRMRSGDEATLWYLSQMVAEPDRLNRWMAQNGIMTMPKAYHAAEFLDEFLRTQRPDDAEAFRLRRRIARERGAMADGNADEDSRALAAAFREAHSQEQAMGATAALRRVLEDQSRVLGPEHRDTCDTRLWLYERLVDTGDMAGAAAVLTDVVADQERTRGPDSEEALVYRHNLGFCLNASGDKEGAVEVFSRLYPDALRDLGPDDPGTLDIRHELARSRGESGDPEGAAAAFAELVADRLRVQGPDHPRTLLSRHHLARWRGEAGDADAAVAEFEQLVADKERVLGPQHQETKSSRKDLEYWRKQARQRGYPMG